MRLFKKRQKKENNGDHGKDKLAIVIVGFIVKMQTAFARFMNTRTRNMSASSLKMSLVIFLLTGSGLSIYFVASAFLEKNKSKVVKIDRIHVPQYYDRTGDESIQPDFFISKQEHEEMQAFQKYMDSLHSSKDGIRIYDSVMLNRPGLLDSLNRLEQMYQQQSQNKK